MFKPELLKSEMVKRKINADILSDKLGINISTFYHKMNGESEFKRSELQIIRNVLNLSIDDIDAIFFA